MRSSSLDKDNAGIRTHGYKLFMNKFKLKIQGPFQSKVSEELSVKVTVANNVSCFKINLGTFGRISICGSMGLCSDITSSVLLMCRVMGYSKIKPSMYN